MRNGFWTLVHVTVGSMFGSSLVNLSYQRTTATVTLAVVSSLFLLLLFVRLLVIHRTYKHGKYR